MALDDATAFSVATHIESCPHCRRLALQAEQRLGDELSSAVCSDIPNFDSMFDDIIALEQNSEPFRLRDYLHPLR